MTTTDVGGVAGVPALKKNFFRLLLLAFSGSTIYGLPYFRLYYYDAYLQVYNLNNTQMGTLGSAYGVLGLLSYLIGGVFADKFSAKKLIVFSLVATGVAGIGHLAFNSFYALVGIYALWGVTSLLTFWPALLKTVRQQANAAEQGRAYGIFEGGRGVVNALHLAVATSIFGIIGARLGNAVGIRMIITFYSVAAILAGILIFFIFREETSLAADIADNSGKFRVADLVRVIKMPSVWMVVVLLFSSYVFNMSFYYFTPYSTSAFGASAVFAAVLTVLAQYCRPVASTGGGFLADKFGRANILFLGFVGMGIGTVAILLMPKRPESIIMLTAACVLIYFAMYGNYGIFFSLLEEGGVPIELSGTAIGLVSTLAYLPEVLCPFVAGRVLDAYEGTKGYQIYFAGMVVLAAVGAVFSIIWTKMYGNREKSAQQLSEKGK
ncbi:MAG: MFS transporter [Synergistaceae bacterium]|nr:MFS transporter [Synergistaceae bacterium]